MPCWGRAFSTRCEHCARCRKWPPWRRLNLPAVRAVGYRQAWEYLDGEGDAVRFRDKAIFATRQLAKRQLTWLRGELDARWFDPHIDHERLAGAVSTFVAR